MLPNVEPDVDDFATVWSPVWAVPSTDRRVAWETANKPGVIWARGTVHDASAAFVATPPAAQL